MFQTGYILCRRDDAIWFLALPFAAIAVALAIQHWLPAIALVSITLLITAPHHFVTWLRTYGIRQERERWKTRLLFGPFILIAIVTAGVTWAPVTLAIFAILWDHQHSVMQQYGFARIYDFKAQTGGPLTPRFDLLLGWFLYINLLITSPLFTRYWVQELTRWQIPLDTWTIHLVQNISWVATALFGVVYSVHLIRGVRSGTKINPVKFVFIGASYLLWYYTSWHTDSILVFGIAHRLMHGLQYIVMVYWYMRRKTLSNSRDQCLAEKLVTPGWLGRFIVACLLYAVAVQFLSGQPMERLGFGLVNASWHVDYGDDYHAYAESVFSIMALTHYYFDSFIWKVREKSTQSGL
jgi:hypothetical protein